jgi:peptidylprolyl isomerase
MSDPIKRAGIILGILLAAVAAFFTVSIAAPQVAKAQEGKPHWILELKDGIVDIELRPDLAPGHVKRVIELTEKGFYDGIVFHRVIDGFMAQTGDPTGTGMGGSDEPDLKAEFSKAPFKRGVLGMARASDPNSANSQFFIMFDDGDWLNGQYTIWGEGRSMAWSLSTRSSAASL